MDRCATLGRLDLAKFAWAVLGAVVGCSLAERCKGMFLFYVEPRGLCWNRIRSIGSSATGNLGCGMPDAVGIESMKVRMKATLFIRT